MTARAGSQTEAAMDDPTFEGDSRWQVAERVVHSSALERATQLQSLLLFVVRQAILHPDEPIHEFDIARGALGRPNDFNPLDDNIVRVQMTRLRKRLDLYFSTEGKNEELVIAISLGSYKPVFSHRPQTANQLDAGSLGSVVTREEAAEAGGKRSRRMPAGRIAAGLIILALAVGYVALWTQNRALERSVYAWRYSPAVAALWSEFLDSNLNTDVVLSDTSFGIIQRTSKQFFSFDDYLRGGYISKLQSQDLSPETRAIISRVSAMDLTSASAVRLTQRILTLDPLGKKMHIYHAREYTPTLIRQGNAILLGSKISNPWQELFEGRLNFIMTYDASDFGTFINRAPVAGELQSYRSTDSTGYCVVAFLPNQDGAGKVLLVVGSSAEATEAAGDFLFSESQLSSFLKQLNATRFPYFEVPLRTSQVHGTPLTATIEAYRTYPNLH